MLEGLRVLSIDVGPTSLLPQWPSRDSIYLLLWESCWKEGISRGWKTLRS